MKFFKILLGGLLFAAGTAALADPPAQVGRLSHVQGTVSFAPADAGNDWIAAPINWPVTNGDRLWADRDGRAEIRIGANAIRAGSSTSLDVLRLDDVVTHLRLAQGTLHIRLRELDAGDSFEIATPSGAVLLTRPGSYRLSVDAAGAATTVLVRQGQADVLTGNAPVPINDHQSVTFSAAGQAFTGAASPDEFDNWAYARDRQSDNLITPQYVSPAMTGHEELDHHGSWHTVPEYGHVWYPTAVAAGWAPYRYGRWVWVSPWGWTWIDNARWGFAPYHYGRWVHIGNRWGWAPGVRVARPVYAPALVAFIGGANWSVSVGGPAVGWVPLGWREPYIPWYRHSHHHVRNVNVTHVTNITVINQYSHAGNARYINRHVPSATTVVTHDTFVRARHVHTAHLNVPARALANAQVTHAHPVTHPGGRHSLAAAQPGTRLPAAIAAREVLTTRAPAALPHHAQEDRPRVRTLATAPGATRATADGAPHAAPAPRERGEHAERGERNGRAERHSPRPENRAMVEPRAPAAPGTTVTTAPGISATPAPSPVAPVPVPRERVERRERIDGQPPRPENRAMVEPRAPAAAVAPTPSAPATSVAPAPPPAAVAPVPITRERGAERSADVAQPRPPMATPAPPAVTPAPVDAQRVRRQHEERQREDQQREDQQRQARAWQQQQLEQAKAQQQQQMQQQRAMAMQQQQLEQAKAQQQQMQQQRAMAVQQQQLEQARAQHQQMQQQRALAVQQQREHQMQQAQQIEQQRQLQRQQRREERQATSRPAAAPHASPPHAGRPKPEPERAPLSR